MKERERRQRGVRERERGKREKEEGRGEKKNGEERGEEKVREKMNIRKREKSGCFGDEKRRKHYVFVCYGFRVVCEIWMFRCRSKLLNHLGFTGLGSDDFRVLRGT